MKSSILIASLLYAFSFGLTAQTAPTYFDSTSFWGYYKWFGTPQFPGSCIHQINDYWNFDGDSSVLGHTWYKLYNTGRYQIDCTFPTGHYDTKYAHRYAGLLRQDGREIHMVFPNAAIDTVIYDFDLKTGDLFLGLPFLPSPNNTVATITPFAADTTRAVFASDPPGDEWGNLWVEGIGALRGAVFGPELISCLSASCATIGGLTCYEMQGNNFGFAECAANLQNYQAIVQAVTDTKNIPADDTQIWLSPNPGRDYLDLYNIGTGVKEIRLVHYSGQVVHIQPGVAPEAGGVISLPVSHLPAGLYQVLVYGQNSVTTLRWVKI